MYHHQLPQGSRVHLLLTCLHHDHHISLLAFHQYNLLQPHLTNLQLVLLVNLHCSQLLVHLLSHLHAHQLHTRRLSRQINQHCSRRRVHLHIHLHNHRQILHANLQHSLLFNLNSIHRLNQQGSLPISLQRNQASNP